MGANAQTSVPTFTAGQVLTAAQMNESARTGVPVFADSTARDAGFGGTGEKTLAEGQLVYLEDSNIVQYYDGSSWATVGPAAASALTLISTTTIGSAVSTVTVTNAFSATYDNYRIIISGGVASTGVALRMTLGASTASYYSGYVGRQWSGNTVGGQVSNGAYWEVAGGQTTSLAGVIDVGNPFLAKESFFTSQYVIMTTAAAGETRSAGGFHNVATSYTDFTIASGAATMTGGTIKVYGFSNS